MKIDYVAVSVLCMFPYFSDEICKKGPSDYYFLAFFSTLGLPVGSETRGEAVENERHSVAVIGRLEWPSSFRL